MSETRTRRSQGRSSPKDLRALLEKAVARRPAGGIIFSGGLDTAVVAALMRGAAEGPGPIRAVSVGVGPKSHDLEASRALAKILGLRRTVLHFTPEELLSRGPSVVRILKTYDPMAIRNHTVIYCALVRAKALGLKTVATGDGGDELFAGYSFLFDKTDRQLDYSLRRMQRIMSFASRDLGEAVGVKVTAPFLDPEVQAFARKLKKRDLIATYRGKKIGKAIVRRCMKGTLPERYLWRTKMPIEIGSGAHCLDRYWEKTISDGTFADESRWILERDGVRIRNKGQLHSYGTYRKTFGPPGPRAGAKLSCPDCRSPVEPWESLYCLTCGLWPVKGRPE